MQHCVPPSSKQESSGHQRPSPHGKPGLETHSPRSLQCAEEIRHLPRSCPGTISEACSVWMELLASEWLKDNARAKVIAKERANKALESGSFFAAHMVDPPHLAKGQKDSEKQRAIAFLHKQFETVLTRKVPIRQKLTCFDCWGKGHPLRFLLVQIALIGGMLSNIWGFSVKNFVARLCFAGMLPTTAGLERSLKPRSGFN